MYYVIAIFVIIAAVFAAIATYIAINRNGGPLPGFWAFVVFCVSGVLLGNLLDPLASKFKPTLERDTAPETSYGSPSMSQGETPSVTFTSTSNGYDWRRVDDDTRRKYCEMMATRMSQRFNRAFTAEFFYASIDEFYRTDDAGVLNTKVNEILALTVTAAMKGE